MENLAKNSQKSLKTLKNSRTLTIFDPISQLYTSPIGLKKVQVLQVLKFMIKMKGGKQND